MLVALALLSLLHCGARSGSVYTEYNSASDTILGLRVVIIDSMYSDAQFLFRELPGLDGSADGVSLMPAANDGFFLCAESNDTDRLVAVRPAVSASLCTFRKVAGLSNPALVSFEQRGKYVGRASAYAYDCGFIFAGMLGWTVGLVARPADATLATWVAAESSPLSLYVQDTNYWLGSCAPDGVFYNPFVGDIAWDAVPALGNASGASSAVSLRVSSSASAAPLYLGVDAAGEQQLSNSSAQSVALRVWDCAGHASACTWTVAQSALSGDFWLTHTASGWTVVRETEPNGLACDPQNAGRALLSRAAAGETLGFWRSNYAQPGMPDVVIPSSSSQPPASSSSSGAAAGVLLPSSSKEPLCSDMETCWGCVGTAMSCGWCSDTGQCARGTASSPTNCTPLMWYFDSCLPRKERASASLVVPLVGVAGGVIVAVFGLAMVAWVVRSRVKRAPPPVLPAATTRVPDEENVPSEGPSVTFSAAPNSLDSGMASNTAFSLGLSNTAGLTAAAGDPGHMVWQQPQELNAGQSSELQVIPIGSGHSAAELEAGLSLAQTGQFQLADLSAGLSVPEAMRSETTTN
eukprot:m51a1_g10307 hypothetical protein (577) ;mRNA; r:77403-79281